jgi:hypothetical protein
MSDEPESKTFRVNDRRRFDSEGNLRPPGEEGVDGAEASPASDAPAVQAKAPPERGPERKAPPERGPEPKAPPERGPEARASGGSNPIQFGDLVLSIATTALAYMGHEPGESELVPGKANLPMAAQNIDILAMLAEKTRGNLSREEEDILNSMLYQLRTMYVELASRRS